MATMQMVAIAIFGGVQMHACFVDESGDLGVLRNPPQPNDQPVLAISGLFVDVAHLASLTDDFLNLKHRFFPRLPYRSKLPLDRILPEVKGAEIRKNVLRGTPRQQSHAISFLDRTIGLLQRYDIRMVGRIWVKGIGRAFDATSVYTSSIQGICSYFDHYLNQNNSEAGVCIADSRNKSRNVRVSHSIFTKKFSAVRPDYHALAELPTFGHSENHAGLQISDIVCSALLYPIACFAYCTGHVQNVHVQQKALILRGRYGKTLKDLQYRYKHPTTGYNRGGIVVSDAIGKQSGSLMFR